jgi:hypothetical protein
MRRWKRVALVAALIVPLAFELAPAQGATPFAVGIPTIVDPIRGAGEPDIVVDNAGNGMITGPGGSGAQTSWFWRSRDGGRTYPLLGPSGGHMVCPASGGGDSLGVVDRADGTLYLTDQEALADVGTAVLKPNGAMQSECATAPAATADRPFEAVFSAGTSSVSKADGNKPIVYLSYLCQACFGSGNTVGGLAYGWSDDGIHFRGASPGSSGGNVFSDTVSEASAINVFSWHGSMVADPRTGWVYTALACDPGNGCPNGAGKNEVGFAVGKPDPKANPSNPGVFSTVDYKTVAELPEASSLFPLLVMDKAGTLYELWTGGDGFADPDAAPSPTSWHIYYSYSLDTPDHAHTTWSAPIRVDHDDNATDVFGWTAAGDAGHLGFVWLESNVREHPSKANKDKQWRPHMAITTNATSTTPTFQEDTVGDGPAHIGDICLEGTVGCIQNVGNRNMADFISVDVDPASGALQATWANDANQLATLPTTLIPGLPIVETARQVTGPRLVGKGNVKTTLFKTKPAVGISDATNDGRYPVEGGTNVPALDLTSSGVKWDGKNLTVTIDAADVKTITSPDPQQSNVWYLTVWQFDHKLYFAKAKVDGLGNVTYTAGAPQSFDRIGPNGQTVATLVDYSGGTTVTGTQTATGFTLTVPASVVGGPKSGALLEAVTAYSALDSGLPPEIGPGAGNVPTLTDATGAYNVKLS